MAEIQYRITERFLPGSPQQREERLESLLAEYRRLLAERLRQERDLRPETGPEAAP